MYNKLYEAIFFFFEKRMKSILKILLFHEVLNISLFKNFFIMR